MNKLKKEFLKLLEIVDAQCDAAGVPRGLFEEITTPEIERFILVQKQLIEMGQIDWVLDALGL